MYDPNFSDGYNERGWCFCFIGKYENAIRDADRALSMSKRHYSYDTRATAYALMGDYTSALKDFDNAILLEKVALYIYKRGIVKLMLNSNAGADIDFKKAKEIDSKENFKTAVDPFFLKLAHKLPLPFYVKNYVEEKITVWQQKGEFEKTADYQKRVTETSRNMMLQQFTDSAINKLKQEYTKNINWKTIKISQYDADNETYLMQSPDVENFALPVPVAEAQEFKTNADKFIYSGQDYYVNKNQLVLAKLVITNPVSNKQYFYDSKKATTYSANNITYNFKPIEINLPQNNTTNNSVISQNTVVIGTSDVDINIPVNEQTNTMTFAVIIANENYTREVKVQYAANDGKIFKAYCENTLGIPSKNIHISIDATFGTMKSEIKWISDVSAAYKGQAKLLFYYAGHGMPDEIDKSAYLLPVDGFSSDFETAIKLNDLYNRLTQNPAISVTVFLDACFSGSLRDDGMLANARGVKIKPKTTEMSGNLIVFTAASGDETAYPYKEKQHGLFTYFLLKKLQETKGNVYYQSLANYISENVKQQSVVVNQKTQTPQVNTSTQLQNSWRTFKLQ